MAAFSPSHTGGGGGPDYSAQWAEYYRSIGKVLPEVVLSTLCASHLSILTQLCNLVLESGERLFCFPGEGGWSNREPDESQGSWRAPASSARTTAWIPRSRGTAPVWWCTSRWRLPTSASGLLPASAPATAGKKMKRWRKKQKTWLYIIFLTDLFHQGAYPGYEWRQQQPIWSGRNRHHQHGESCQIILPSLHLTRPCGWGANNVCFYLLGKTQIWVFLFRLIVCQSLSILYVSIFINITNLAFFAPHLHFWSSDLLIVTMIKQLGIIIKYCR